MVDDGLHIAEIFTIIVICYLFWVGMNDNDNSKINVFHCQTCAYETKLKKEEYVLYCPKCGSLAADESDTCEESSESVFHCTNCGCHEEISKDEYFRYCPKCGFTVVGESDDDD